MTVVATYRNKEISVFFDNSITAADTDNDNETSSANHQTNYDQEPRTS